MALKEVGVKLVVDGLSGFKSKMGDANRTMSDLGGTLKTMRPQLLGVGTAMTGAAAAIGVVGVKSAADFELAMREVNSMIGLNQREFQDFSDDIQDLSKTLGVDAVESAKGLYQAISAGVPKDNALEFMEIASKAAIAGVTDTATAVDGLTTVINAFKVPMEDAQHIADVMFQTVKGGKTNFEELSGYMFQVASVASAANVSFEEVAAGLAAMTIQGIPTRQATTGLRQAIASIIAPTEDMIDVFREGVLANIDQGSALGGLQFDLNETTSELNELRDAYLETTAEMAEMTNEIDELGDQQAEIRLKIKKIRYAAAVEGRELTEQEKASIDELTLTMDGLGISADELRIKQDDLSEAAADLKVQTDALAASEKEKAAAFIAALDEEARGMGQAMLESQGLQATLEFLADAAGGSTDKLSSMFGSVEALQSVLSLTGENADLFSDSLNNMEHASDGAGAATEAYDEINKSAARRWAEMTVAIKDLAIEIGQALMPILMTLFNALKPIFEKVAKFVTDNPKLTAAIVIITGVLGTLLLALVAVPTAITAIKTSLLAVKAVMLAMTAGGGPIGLILIALAALVAVTILVVKHWDKISAFFKKVWKEVSKVFKKAWDTIYKFIKKAADKIWKFLKKWGKVILGIIFPVAGIAMIIYKWRDKILGYLKKVLDKIIDFFKDLWDDIEDVLKNIIDWFKNLGRNITSALRNVAKKIYEPFEDAYKWVIDKLDEILDWFADLGREIGRFVTDIYDSIKEPFRKAYNWVIDKLEGILDWFADLGYEILRFVNNIFNAIKEPFRKAWNWINWNVLEPVINWFKNLPGNILNFFVSIWHAIREPFRKAWNWIDEHVLSPVINFFKELPGKLWEFVGDIYRAIKKPFSKAYDWIKMNFFDKITDLINVMISGLNLLPGVNIKKIGEGTTVEDKSATEGFPYGQHGGLMTRSGGIIVGERGPELVSLPAGAIIHPNETINNYTITENYARPEAPQSLDLSLQALAMYART